MKRFVLAFALLVFPAFAHADNRAILALQAQECTTPGQSCAMMRGSCVAVGRTATGDLLVLTAAHVVRTSSSVQVYVGSGWQPARVLRVTKQDGNWDLALVQVHYREPWPCLRIVRDALGIERSEVEVAGYAGGLRWTHRRGIFGNHTDHMVWWHNAPPQSGQSGGAVIVNDQLVGIISGRSTQGSMGVGNNAAAIRVFLGSCGVTIVYPEEQQTTPPPVAGIPNPATGPKPGDTIPNPAKGPDASQEVAKLQAQLAKVQSEFTALQAELNVLKNRPIEVEIRNPETKEVKSRSFAPGEPIRLQLPSRQP